MALGFLFHHGWGLDQTFFHALGAQLTKHFSDCIYVGLDRGYFCNPVKSSVVDLEKGDRTWIGIGHSLGFHFVSQLPIQKLISINGFTRFCSFANNKEGTPRRILDRMIDQFAKDPVLVLKEFYKRADLPYKESWFSHLNKELLLQDLVLLRDLDGTQSFLADSRPSLSLRTKEDPIVLAALYEETMGLKKAEDYFYPGKGHGISSYCLDLCIHIIVHWVKMHD